MPQGRNKGSTERPAVTATQGKEQDTKAEPKPDDGKLSVEGPAKGGAQKRASPKAWKAAEQRVKAKRSKVAARYREATEPAAAGQGGGKLNPTPFAMAAVAMAASAEELSKLRWEDVEDPAGSILLQCRKQKGWLDGFSRAMRAGQDTPAKWLEMLRKLDLSRTVVVNCTRQLRSALPLTRPGRSEGRGSGEAEASASDTVQAKNLALWRSDEKYSFFVLACVSKPHSLDVQRLIDEAVPPDCCRRERAGEQPDWGAQRIAAVWHLIRDLMRRFWLGKGRPQLIGCVCGLCCCADVFCVCVLPGGVLRYVAAKKVLKRLHALEA